MIYLQHEPNSDPFLPISLFLVSLSPSVYLKPFLRALNKYITIISNAIFHECVNPINFIIINQDM